MGMKNVSVRWKMIILALITLIGTLAIGVLAVNRMLVMEKGSESVLRTSIEEDYDENIRNQVDNAISMLDAVYAGYENGDYSYEEAETRGADLLRELRYGDGGYFWADTYDGDNVVLLGSETEGTNRIDDLPDYITLIFHFSDKISDLALHILKALAENTKVVPAVLKLYRQRLRKITLCNITDVRECNLK